MSPRLSPGLCEWAVPITSDHRPHYSVSSAKAVVTVPVCVCERETSQPAAVTAGGVTCLFLLGAVRITHVHVTTLCTIGRWWAHVCETHPVILLIL